MRFKVIAILTLILSASLLNAADLFISEYVEGSSYNKAIEIFNPTNQIVDLSQYTLKQANNGSGWGRYTPSGGTPTDDNRYVLQLSGYLNPGDVYVVYNGQAASAIISVGDSGLTYSTDPNCLGCNVPSFNGDDAIGLFKGDVLIDVIGTPDVDPGTAWSVAGTSNATLDYTLVRKPTILNGNTNWSASAGTNADNSEWIVYPKDTFTYLGFHTFVGGKNVKPIANAGSDMAVWTNSSVTLDGSGSLDPDGRIVSYAWSQIAGPSVTLSNADSPTATFTAPEIETQLSFKLTVTDDSSATDLDTVDVKVLVYKNLFISEYVEGSSNNKYIEIYNGEDEAVDLTAAGFELRTAFNGSNSYTAVFSGWNNTLIPAKGVVVIANTSATIYSGTKIVVPSGNYTINFNGNDAVGLFRYGTLIDIIGYPERSDTILADMTMRRKSTVARGNTRYTPEEWAQYAQDDISGLGVHVSNPNAPTISNIAVAPDFILANNEITISANLQALVGTIATAQIKYGTGGILVNTADMWLESGDLWMGNIPPQPGNSKLEFKIVAYDNAGNQGESPVSSVLIADTQPLDISQIHANITQYEGQLVTIRGIVTIGAGVLRNDRTSAYIQDASGRGLNLYDEQLYNTIQRGDELLVVGYVDLYYSTVEVTAFAFQKLASGKPLPEAPSVSVAAANSSDWEGTLLQLNGVIKSKVASGTSAYNLTVVYNADSIIVRIPNATGININDLNEGSAYWFRGVGYKYSTQYQLLVGYQEDIWSATAITPEAEPVFSYKLLPCYPNPFNASTVINWQLAQAGSYELAVYNVLGQKVAVIHQGVAPAGEYNLTWQADNLSTGIYFLILEVGNRRYTQKLSIIK